MLNTIKAAAMASAALAIGVSAPQFAAAQIVQSQVPAVQDPAPQAKTTRAFSAGAQVTNSAVAVGSMSGTLNVSSITIANFATTTQQIFIFDPVTSDGTCSGSVIGGSTPSLYAVIPAQQTVQLNFPTPLVMLRSNHASCIAFEATTNLNGGSFYVFVVGQSIPPAA